MLGNGMDVDDESDEARAEERRARGIDDEARPREDVIDPEAVETLRTFVARMKTTRFLVENLIGAGGLRADAPVALLLDGISRDGRLVYEAAVELLARLGDTDSARDDARDARRYRFLRDNPIQLRAIDGSASFCGYVGAELFDGYVDAVIDDPTFSWEGRTR